MCTHGKEAAYMDWRLDALRNRQYPSFVRGWVYLVQGQLRDLQSLVPITGVTKI